MNRPLSQPTKINPDCKTCLDDGWIAYEGMGGDQYRRDCPDCTPAHGAELERGKA